MNGAEGLADVVAAWRGTAALHRIGDPLDEAGLARAEARLGRALPADLRRLYEACDGFDGFGGSLFIAPALRAADYADDLRDSDWVIGPELIVFGGNGAGDFYALWYPDGAPPDDPTPVIEIGEIFEDAGLALIGTSLPRFLRSMTAFRLAYEGEEEAAAALGVPPALRSRHERFAPFIAWADPTLPFPEPDPYVQRLTTEDIARLVRSRA
jgi:hypothetical protein